jgi:hypothetical protein
VYQYEKDWCASSSAPVLIIAFHWRGGPRATRFVHVILALIQALFKVYGFAPHCRKNDDTIIASPNAPQPISKRRGIQQGSADVLRQVSRRQWPDGSAFHSLPKVADA